MSTKSKYALSEIDDRPEPIDRETALSDLLAECHAGALACFAVGRKNVGEYQYEHSFMAGARMTKATLDVIALTQRLKRESAQHAAHAKAGAAPAQLPPPANEDGAASQSGTPDAA
jgi:hypothetical protein